MNGVLLFSKSIYDSYPDPYLFNKEFYFFIKKSFDIINFTLFIGF